MIEFARTEFAREDDALLEPADPPRLHYLWRWFLELSDCREMGMGIGPILPSEIEAWSRICNVDASPIEIDTIRQIDRAFRRYRHEREHPAPPPPSKVLAEAAAVAKAQREAKRR